MRPDEPGAARDKDMSAPAILHKHTSYNGG
jgi:hypothetical protein